MLQRTLKLLSFLFCTSLVLMFTSCQSTSKKAQNDPILPVGYEPSPFEQLTTDGLNTQPRISPKGDLLLYISAKRFRHSQPQVYEMNLSSKSERRVTFSDGETASPVYHKFAPWVFYTSSTDEIKEDPDFLHSSQRAELTPNVNRDVASVLQSLFRIDRRFEIYASHPNGSNIRRLTSRPGFDGDMDTHPKRNVLAYSSLRDGQTDLFTIDPSTGSGQQLTRTEELELQPQYSRNGESLAWVQTKDPFQQSQIWVGRPGLPKTHKAITVHNALNIQPSWHPSGDIVFSSNRKGGNFELYVMHNDGSCLRRLTYSAGDETEPEFSPDGKTVYFTSTKSGEPQIYRMSYRPPDSCPEG